MLARNGAASRRPTLRAIKRAVGPPLIGRMLDTAKFAATAPWGFCVRSSVGRSRGRALRFLWLPPMTVDHRSGSCGAVSFAGYVSRITWVSAIADDRKIGEKRRRTMRRWCE